MGASAVVTVALLGLVLCSTMQTLGGEENVGETVPSDATKKPSDETKKASDETIESIDDEMEESGVKVEIIEESKECSRYVHRRSLLKERL